MEKNEMKLYVWKIDGWSCHCRYSVIAESLEEAREVAIYNLMKNKEKNCNMCIASEELDDYLGADFDTRKGISDRLWNRGNYVIRNWIRDAEPNVYEAKKLIRG